MILVTGGAGFIGSNFIHEWIKNSEESVINVDKLTYSGNLENLKNVQNHKSYQFVQADICDEKKLKEIIEIHKPRAIVHFAAESHVDRSIHSPIEFIKTNILGTFNLLEVARNYWIALDGNKKASFRFLHISTDEVYGSLGECAPAFNEEKKYEPNSPYSASKAGSDHLVRAYFHTYGLPVLTTNCSNNYGPFQFPEKLIPLMIHNALEGKALPIYGDGKNIRDWLYVLDHCSAIRAVLERGITGEVYNIGGDNEVKNIDVVNFICEILDKQMPKKSGSYKDQITFVKDRPGHDMRYAIESTKIKKQLNWKASETFESGMKKTVEWYLANAEWVQHIVSGSYQDWIKKNYN